MAEVATLAAAVRALAAELPLDDAAADEDAARAAAELDAPPPAA
jgi:hypothetical protein